MKTAAMALQRAEDPLPVKQHLVRQPESVTMVNTMDIEPRKCGFHHYRGDLLRTKMWI